MFNVNRATSTQSHLCLACSRHWGYVNKTEQKSQPGNTSLLRRDNSHNKPCDARANVGPWAQEQVEGSEVQVEGVWDRGFRLGGH